MHTHEPNEEAVFQLARKLENPQDRNAYLDQVCAGNPPLRERVEALLAVHDNAQSDFLRSNANGDPDVAVTAEQSPMAERPGTHVGPYKLMEEIGEGGFGKVFVAEQQKPMRRKVALKVIKPGMDSREIIARFEAERQALALMDHPNIARVLDAGTTDSGRPYFVMELVKGMPIVDYCDGQQLSTHERLELFISVCQAVQHAHSKGVIHRDLKPSNVMVAPHDGKPVVKVIDFGIAKAIGQQLTEKTIYTRLHQMIGSPLYMSPEQAEINALDVDTRSDVYSLGVLLYELLTGTTPFDRHRFATAAYDEIRRIIGEEDPPKPSTRLSSLGETLTTVSAKRNTEPAKLSAQVSGDLDWIVMKCLEKDRTRRYETATSLAADVQRHLSNEPIEARPPSTGYKLRKFVRRNKGPVAAGLAVLASLIIGIAAATTGYVKASHTAQELRSLALKYYDEQVRNALQFAFAGDLARTEEIGETLDRMSTDFRISHDARIHPSVLRGIAHTYGGDESAALTETKLAMRTSPEDLSLLAVRARAFSRMSEFELMLETLKRIESLVRAGRKPTPYEQLLRITVLMEPDAHKAVRLIESIPPDTRRWPLARAIIAAAFGHLAVQSYGDHGHLATALEESKLAEASLPKNPTVLSVGLWVRTLILHYANDEGSKAEARSVGEQLAQRLRENYPNFRTGTLVRAFFLGEVAPESEELATLLQRDIGFNSAIKHYAEGDYDSALRDLSQEDRTQNRVVGALIEADKERDLGILLEADRSLAAESLVLPAKLESLKLLLWSGHIEKASREANSLVHRAQGYQSHGVPFTRTLKYVAGVIDADAFEQAAGKSKLSHLYSCFWIASKKLGSGEREGAMEYFQKCVDTDIVWYRDHMVAKVLLVRFREDRRWPPWITQ